MFIEKEDRVSHAAPPSRSSWDGSSRRRAPRNWQKTIRLTLYGLIGLLAGMAALASIALFFGQGGPPAAPPNPIASPDTNATLPAAPPPMMADLPPAPTDLPPAPTATQPPPASPSRPPPQAALMPPPPAPPAPAPVTSPPPAAAPDAAATRAMQTLQQQIREANEALAGLRSEAERLRQGLSDTVRQHTLPARPVPPPAPSADAQQPTDSWADAERTIQALAQRAPPPAAPTTAASPAAAPPVIATPHPPPAPPAAPTPTTTLATNAPPDATAAAPAMPRPRVYLHYPAGSRSGLQTTTDIAQRLLFSDFAYADTRSSANMPASPVIRYFYPEDEPAAERLASLLGGSGPSFRVVDATNQPGHATRGTLDVWVGR